MNNKIFSKANIVLFIISSIFIFVSYILNYTVKKYPFTIISPIVMALGYTPFALIERNIAKLINNKVISLILYFHILFTTVMILFYFLFVILISLNII